MGLERDEVLALTSEYGGEWGSQHSERLLRLVALIDEGQTYDKEALWLAVRLHDWGGYAEFAEPGVDHAQRSAEVADGFLRERGCPEERIAVVLDAIRTHHSAGPGRSIEAVLLSDADALDFLGAIGLARMFSMKPRDLRGAYETAVKRRQRLPHLLCMERSRALAAGRLTEMDKALAVFETETFGLF